MKKNNYQEFMSDFASYLFAIKNLSDLYVKNIKTTVSQFLQYMNVYKYNNQFENIDDITLNDIRTLTNTDIYSYIFYLAKNNYKQDSRSIKIEHLRTFFDFLFKIKSDKFKQIRNNAIITLCLNCGLRISEVCKLNVSDIKENSDTFIIYGKGRKERTGYLNKQTKEMLLCYIQEREKYALQKNIITDALFITERKCRITPRTIQRDLKSLYKKAEIDENKYSVHTLRHTCATILYKSGYDIKLIQEILGHSSVNTTKIYTHLYDKEVEKTM